MRWCLGTRRRGKRQGIVVVRCVAMGGLHEGVPEPRPKGGARCLFLFTPPPARRRAPRPRPRASITGAFSFRTMAGLTSAASSLRRRPSRPRESPRSRAWVFGLRNAHMRVPTTTANPPGPRLICRDGRNAAGASPGSAGRPALLACPKRDSEQLRFAPRTWLPHGGGTVQP
jgi:hypothetical protein